MTKPRIMDELLIRWGSSPPAGWPSRLQEEATKIVADEPARYYWEESDQEFWHQVEEFQNIAPPFHEMWIEWKGARLVNSREWGVITPVQGATAFCDTGAYVRYFDLDNNGALPDKLCQVPAGEVLGHWDIKKLRWIASVVMVMRDSRYAPGDTSPLCVYFIGVGPDGRMALTKEGQIGPGMHIGGALHEPAGTFATHLNVVLLTIFFMHAKGTQLTRKRVPAKVKAKRRKKKRAVGCDYLIVDVGLGFRRSLRDAKDAGGGLKRALRTHLRKGHFATYTEEKPHVSGFVGTMWRRPTVVKGDAGPERRYRVRSKAGKEARESAMGLGKRETGGDA